MATPWSSRVFCKAIWPESLGPGCPPAQAAASPPVTRGVGRGTNWRSRHHWQVADALAVSTTTAPAPPAAQPIDGELPELELIEVEEGLNAKLILGGGAICALLTLYAVFNVVTGNLGMTVLLMLLLGIGGGFFVFKQIQGAETGELKVLKDKLEDKRRQSSMAKPSVTVRGGLLDI